MSEAEDLREFARLGSVMDDLRQDIDAVADRRALLLHQIYERGGKTMRALAAEVGLSGPRVQQIVAWGRELAKEAGRG